MKAFLDFIPLIAFFIGFKMQGAVAGAGALLIATVIIHIIHFFQQGKKLNKQQWLMLILTIVFCGVSVILNDKFFIQAKSVVINSIFVIALIISILIDKPLMKMAMNQMFELTNSGWKKLTLAWAVFFAAMAFAHYYTAFHMSEEVWSNFKFWGWIPIMLTFMIGQFLVLRNHLNPNFLENQEEKEHEQEKL